MFIVVNTTINRFVVGYARSGTMKWKNASLDEHPEHLKVVLVSVEGVYYITIYDSHTNIYRFKDEPESFFSPEEHLIYWTEFVSPTDED
jgi:hypothetical protein